MVNKNNDAAVTYRTSTLYTITQSKIRNTKQHKLLLNS